VTRVREPRQAILILGMHRSGTSALARVLGLCGGTLPRDTWSPDEHNTTGYWEPAPIVTLHDEILRSADSSFDDVGVPRPGWHSSVAASGFGERLAEALESAYGNAPLWVVKDPRMCRLVPLWEDVLARLEVVPLAVIPVRSPLEVAASLAERDGFPVAKSLLLWLRHFLEAEVATRGMRRSFVSYDALLEDWRQVVNKIGRDLALAWPLPPEDGAPQVESFLDLRVRHHALSEREPAAHPEVGAWVGTVYDWAVEAARHRPPATAPIDAVRASLSIADATFLPLLSEFKRDRSRLQEVEAALAGKTSETERLRREVAGASRRGEKAVPLGASAATPSPPVRTRDFPDRWLDLLLRLHSIDTSASWQSSARSGWAERRQRVLVRGLRGIQKVLLWAASGRLARRLLIRREAKLILRSGLFDERWYAEQNPDVARAGGSPLAHYLEQDPVAGGDPNPLFDRRWYAARTPELARSGIDALTHYVLRGAEEGRDPNPLFDSHWYLQGYPDVAASGMNPLAHFLHHGAREGRDPNPLFDSGFYLRQAPEVAVAGTNPLVHYLESGVAEGWDPSPLFDGDWYLKRYSDVAASGVNPLAHYLHHGAREGRDPNPLFDSRFYLRQDPDIASAGANPLVHYLERGAAEGRDPSPLFDTDWYLGRYPDVAASGLNPLAHFLHHGGREGRDPHPLFDSAFYLRQGKDIAAAGVNPLVHFLESGAAAGRDPSPLFDTDWYRRRYPDVAASGVNPLVHYLESGAAEGRDPNPLFDGGWYLEHYPEVAAERANPLVHFLQFGAAEGRDPSPLFDTDWYRRRYPDVAASGINPLVHYLEAGAAEGRDPHPLFDGSWYLKHYPDIAAVRANPLAHFVQSGAADGWDPNPLFVTGWYRGQYPDVEASGLNPLVHYLQIGAIEGRDPGPFFDTDWYASQNPDAAGQNPLAHYLHVGSFLGRLPRAGAPREAYFRDVLSSPTARAADHRDFVPHEPLPTELKLLAFYLPQFHPIPENDQWWGRGFTEWTNVSRAVPQFVGHYQPRLPGELGFYDLRLVEVQRRQVELARNYGIHGFCFHFYWFGGKRLLERPLEQFVADPSLDFPFCVCWANENWSRRWDGSEHEVLIAQEHSPEDDLALITELSKLFADRRYVRVGGKPLLVVYRVDILPDAAATAERWRERCRELGVGEIFLVAAQSFGIDDPRPFGFDAAVEFPPHGAQAVQPITSTIEVLNPSFAGHIFSFDAFADLFKRIRRPPAYPLFRTVCPSWDNTARVLERGHVYHGSTPGSYRDWLLAACRFADAHPVSGEKIVFINAWNEWSEGAHLEPDRRYGHAYLEATREVLSAWSSRLPTR
jgi:hypothetical protein